MMMMMVPTFAVTTAHPFVLTVSHGLLFRQPLLSATARLPSLLSIHRKSITSAERRTKFRLNGQSRYPGSILALAVTTPANQAFPRPFWPRRSKLFAARQPRLPTRRTHETSRSEHDLNLAILYAVQSGFRYSASLLCLTCAADLLEPTIMEPTIMLRAFKATRHPHPRAIP
jgi:hypothetical protein